MDSDDRSPFAKAVGTASQISTIGLTAVLPALFGFLLDNWLRTVLLFTVLGLGLGISSAILQLSRLIKQLNREGQSDSVNSANGDDRG